MGEDTSTFLVVVVVVGLASLPVPRKAGLDDTAADGVGGGLGLRPMRERREEANMLAGPSSIGSCPAAAAAPLTFCWLVTPPRKACSRDKAGRDTSHLYRVLTGLKLTTKAEECSVPSSACARMTSRATFICRGSKTRR